ncbi:MAG TPA: hypothetical protein EYP41_07800 [Anaerolineae bacterium]|nr:hypothetical protein [Anaerolineae bacterium]HIP72953.1 hypothetical protein [Anaerolineae bacterium]
MAFIQTLHQGLANMAWMYFLAIGIWGMYRAIRGQDINSSYLGACVIGQILFIINIVIGAIIWLGGGGASLVRAEVHLLYGAFVLVFLPFIYLAVLRGDDSNRGQWVISFVNLFLFGVSLRLITTGL